MPRGAAEDPTGFDLGGPLCIYSGNITTFGGKATALFGHKLLDEAKGEKAMVVCLQEIHKNKKKRMKKQAGWKRMDGDPAGILAGRRTRKRTTHLGR